MVLGKAISLFGLWETEQKAHSGECKMEPLETVKGFYILVFKELVLEYGWWYKACLECNGPWASSSPTQGTKRER